MNKADLHLHTRYSDGYNTVDEIVQMAVDAGLSHIAITDHDNLDGWKEVSRKVANAGLQTVQSVEISTMDYEIGKIVHILGYHIKDEYPIRTICDPVKKARNEKAFMQVKILNQLGYDLDYDELFRFANGYIFKQHIFELLYLSDQAESIFPSMNETLFKKGKEAYIPMSYIDTRLAVQAVKESGGYAVIAHPGQQDNIESVHRLVKCGLDGIEFNHEANSGEYKKLILDYAKQYKLFLTGGSDYHGAYARRKDQVGSYLSEKSGYKIFE